MAIKLNNAESSVWNFYFKNPDNYKMSVRIGELSNTFNISPKEKRELNSLIKEEKKMLTLAEAQVTNDKNILLKISESIKKFNDDERLILNFDLRLEGPLRENKIKTPEDIEKIFHEMMIDDMELDSHEKMVKEYEKLKANDFFQPYLVPLTAEDFEYVYQPLLKGEEDYLKERLDILALAEGRDLNEEETKSWLMLRIIRLEYLINEYYLTDEDLADDNDEDD